MILHLVHDDKVVPRMISQFEEVCPGKSIYLCVSDITNKSDLKFLNNNDHIILSQSKELSKIPWKSIDKVCFHFLSFKKIRCYWKLCIKYSLKHTTNIWFFWGADIYDILGRRGFRLYSDNNSFYKAKGAAHVNKSIKASIDLFLEKLRYSLSYYSRCFFLDKKIDFVVCNSEDEFELFCKYVRFSRCKGRLNYQYYPVEDTLGELMDLKLHGNSIIIGNSANPTNNHEYILQLLEGVSYGERKVYVPLNYSRLADYVRVIEDKYSTLPGVVILNDFMPLDDYHRLLADCSTFIYGHFRAEAWGNIMVALYLGGKVYVSKHSILPAYLNSLGCKFFTTEDLGTTFQEELSEEEMNRNRRIVMKNFSKEVNREYIKYICSL